MIPPITLPSNPSQTVKLRKPTMAEVIDFSGFDPAKTEKAITLYLNTVQEKDAYSDSALWTGDDRLTVLYWAMIHQNQETLSTFEYGCKCGRRHSATIDMIELGNGYRKITGAPERDTEFDGEKITVRPLLGKHLEELENIRFPLDEYEYKMDSLKTRLESLKSIHGPDSDEYWSQMDEIDAFKRRKGPCAGWYHQLIRRLEILTVAFSIDFLEDNELDPDKRRRKKETRLEKMDYDRFASLAETVSQKIDEMDHGLNSSISQGRLWVVTRVACPEGEEVNETSIRLPFRISSVIPGFFPRELVGDFE